ncbi:hypothetical protein GF337_13195 [candidate division KSB1 bacterium]|nr:hypothetical protein [candidate division KSB1 bacterium]
MEPLQIIGDNISSWLEALISMLPNLFIALLILLATYFLVKIVKRISLKTLGKSRDEVIKIIRDI